MKKLREFLIEHPKALVIIESVGWGLIGVGIGYALGCILSFA